MYFNDRVEAGQKLARALKKYQGRKAIIYALPRGGVVIGAEIAKALKIPLNLLIVRKIGHPHNPEYAIGAVTEGGTVIFNEAEKASVGPSWLKEEIKRQQEEAKRRRLLYLPTNHEPPTTSHIAILVDDGVATGLTMKAAILEIKKTKPQKIVVAVPIAPKEIIRGLKKEVDRIIVLEKPEEFSGAVGAYYQNFPQVSDEEVVNLLKSTGTAINF